MTTASAPPPVEVIDAPVLKEDKVPGGTAAQESFMHSSWHKDTTVLKVFLRNPLGAIMYVFMYKVEQRARDLHKMPHFTVIAQHAFIFPRALPPVIAQYISMKYFDYTWPLPVASVVYSVYLVLFSYMMIKFFERLVERYGYFDNGVPRDQIPDAILTHTALAPVTMILLRPLMGCFLAYDQFETPHLSIWFPVHLFFFTVILDFYFYTYHRAMHEVDFLWKFHKTHHMTKHPTPLLSGFGSTEQDVFDILFIPLLAALTYQVNFHTWWVCTVYIIWSEVAAHSGLRAHLVTPAGGAILKYFDMDLAIEDHDLHHRNGWRESFNYGKQTRLWDKLFGTTRNRIESITENVAWNEPVPVYY